MLDDRTYLVVADESVEFESALRFAAKAAKRNNAYIAVLYVMPDSGFEQWGALEDRIHADHRKEAEKILQVLAEKILDISGLNASLFVGEGQSTEAVIKTIKENPNITNLFLGGSTKAAGPGPMISFFTGKGISKLPVPMTIVPDHIVVAD